MDPADRSVWWREMALKVARAELRSAYASRDRARIDNAQAKLTETEAKLRSAREWRAGIQQRQQGFRVWMPK